MTDLIKLYTVADLEALPDDGMHWSLIAGALIEETKPRPLHSLILSHIMFALDRGMQARKLGLVIPRLGCWLAHDPDTLLVSDVGYISHRRFPNLNLEEFIPGAPDLVVEVISPSDSDDEVCTKIALYMHYGTQVMWVIYVESQRVFVYRADGTYQIVERDGVLNGADVLPDFELKLSDVFAEVSSGKDPS